MPSYTDPSMVPYPADMRWHIQLYPKPKHVRITLSGKLAIGALRDVWTDVFKQKLWLKDAPIVFDLAAIEVTDLSFKEIEAMVEMLPEIKGDLPRGRLLVIAGANVQFGKTRQYQTLADLRKGLHVDVFRDLEQALNSIKYPTS